MITQRELAELIQEAIGEPVVIVDDQPVSERRVLSGRRYESEFGNPFFCEVSGIVEKILQYM